MNITIMGIAGGTGSGKTYAAKNLLNLKNRPSEKEMRKIAESWVPYRSVCAIILWHFYRNFKSRESTLW